MTDDNLLPFCFPVVRRKKITAAFDGGRISSDGGVMLLAQAERRLGIADQLARVIPDKRDASRVVHLLPDILRARIFAIACGYEDADGLDRLRFDPALKLACGRLPDTGRGPGYKPSIGGCPLGLSPESCFRSFGPWLVSDAARPSANAFSIFSAASSLAEPTTCAYTRSIIV